MVDMDSMVSRRFGGIARLYGSGALQRFQEAHVCVVGVGGVGSWSVEALARSGIGNLTLIDLDNVAESNVNRQLHALSDDFGKPKVSALHERIVQINPECRVTEIEDFVDEDNLDTLFRRPFDFVIDAIDQIKVKAAMADYFVKHRQPFILSGGAGGQRNPALIQTTDLSKVTHDPLLANLRYTLRKKYGFSRDTKAKMHVPCVYSTENITPPQMESGCTIGEAPQGLSCAGYGASMLVTATFGLYCAQAAIDFIAGKK
ncbi:tRNA threonylcarbamoyladenosine dehydratase [Neisseria lisongii]|uniref:tRNA threonylcarbamoyladenosine dehydratase n=1 Tax=Neisseria lisongii TaxID=2912188 RepID=A0AAW5AJY2_9NEIS|nr:tRNA threonylcarbamoyladenosine dehydratase [Neisseria lisongii]MCF7528770.1 tRNA threonylcarbamoyladenosine dehydratase [Neisseria lisongii]MCF7529628.1 tRNA threonylcarbamoyladenosine dehydratase [Neisseria lisongii]